MWLVGEGGIYGCGCKEVYILLIPTPLVFVFLQQHPYFLLIKNFFSFLFQYSFVIKCYV